MFKVKLNKFRKKLTISNTYLLAQLYFFKTEVTLNKIFEMDAFKKYQPFKLMSYLRILAIVFSLISVINGFSQIPSYLSPNLFVGYWPFNGTANDLSGYGNNAVLVALISLKIEKVTQIVPVILPIIQILLAWSFSKIRMEY